MTRRTLVLLLAVVFAFEALTFGVLVGATVSPLAGLGAGAAAFVAPAVAISSIMWWFAWIVRWPKWARELPGEDEPVGWDEELVSMAIRWRWVAINGCVSVRADDAGVLIRVSPPFNTGLGPIRIPWDRAEVTVVKGGAAQIAVEGLGSVWVPDRVVRPWLEEPTGAAKPSSRA